MHILTAEQEALRNQERAVLSELRDMLVRCNAAPEDLSALKDSIQQLDEFFLLVVVGEFNAGKSAMINALIGQQILKEGVTPTTTQINILRFGETEERKIESDFVHIITAPVNLLRQLSIVDTPGTNAIIREHELITTQFLPKADLVLFITSSDRPFTESERAFLQKIRDWGKKVVFLINKIDILQSLEDLNQVQNFVSENAEKLLGVTPEVFPISARQALHAKQGEPDLWENSRFAALESYIEDRLDDVERVKLKFANPLGVGSYLIERYSAVFKERLTVLQDDFAALNDVDQQLNLYKEDMKRDFEFRMADIENVLYEMEQRGSEYFDDTIRIARVFDLINKKRVQQGFEQRVIADTPKKLEEKVGELVDWLVEADLRQWQAVTEHLADRRRQHKDRIVGDPGVGSFHFDRERLIEGVNREAQRVVESYDRSGEAEALAESAQTAVAAAAALEVGAIGLGAIVTMIATTVAADVTGILVASLIAALGLFVIPARRRQARTEMHQKIAGMKEKLVTTLREQFGREIERSLVKIQDAIAPYTRFVRAERGQSESGLEDLEKLRNQVTRLKNQVEEIG